MNEGGVMRCAVDGALLDWGGTMSRETVAGLAAVVVWLGACPAVASAGPPRKNAGLDRAQSVATKAGTQLRGGQKAGTKPETRGIAAGTSADLACESYRRPIGWALVGIGSAAVLGTAIWVEAAESAYDEACGPHGLCSPNIGTPLRADVERRRATSPLFYGLGAASAVAGLIVLLRRSTRASLGKERGGIEIGVATAPRMAMVRVAWR